MHSYRCLPDMAFQMCYMVCVIGSQFASAEFAGFVNWWGFEHVMSSLHYAQSSGKAESAVKTVKHLFTKCKKDGTLDFLTLLGIFKRKLEPGWAYSKCFYLSS